MTKVTITFTVEDDMYSEYESALSDFENALPEVDMEITEEAELSKSSEKINNVTVYKQTTCEVDEDWFKNTVANDGSRTASFDYRSLLEMENRPVCSYLKENYPEQLELLKKGYISYIEVAYS